jgi:uncharacterized membrane protein
LVASFGASFVGRSRSRELLRAELLFVSNAMNRLIDEKKIHLVFEVSLILKGILALLEIAGGILAFFITQQFLLRIILAVTHEELTEDPHDFLVGLLLQSARNFSVSSQHFAALYLVGHGVVKAFLIAGLMRGIIWFYPAAITVFLIFIMYQLYRFNLTHSIWLLAITLLDIVVIWLTWHEYMYVRRRHSV